MPVKWIFNNNKSSFPLNAFPINSTTLKIKAITIENRGVYECKGRSTTYFYAIAKLFVIGKIYQTL